MGGRHPKSAIEREPRRIYFRWSGSILGIIGIYLLLTGQGGWVLLAGVLLYVVQYFFPAETVYCPGCGLLNSVEKQVKAYTCQHCNSRAKLVNDVWVLNEGVRLRK